MRAWPLKGAPVAGLVLAILLAAGVPAGARDLRSEAVAEFIEDNVRSWLGDPVIVEAVRAQNEAHAGLTEADIDALDAVWRRELASAERPMIDRVLSAPLSLFLRERQREADGLITEIFVMDAKGLNVGQSDITSDYWQGDEAKWQRSFGGGPGTLFIEEASRDESTQLMQSHASLPIIDPASGAVIGAVTIGVNLDAL